MALSIVYLYVYIQMTGVVVSNYLWRTVGVSAAGVVLWLPRRDIANEQKAPPEETSPPASITTFFATHLLSAQGYILRRDPCCLSCSLPHEHPHPQLRAPLPLPVPPPPPAF